ncbi:MAG: beta-glucosidase, partial [Lachnospiraceae bacterium]|nr:beta-glucosidase [Lachnospiraceae bacterium]
MEVKKNTSFWDVSLPIEERLDWLLSEMTMDEKLGMLATRVPELERLGIPAMSVGGEAAHGVEARNDQNELGGPETTTSFPQPIGMSATWDTELIKKAGEVTGTEARVIYHRHPDRGLSRWAPTIDLERD